MSNKEKNTEKIRDLLRQKLADNDSADNGWNVPSDKVWAGLADELQSSPSPVRRGSRLYLSIGLALALLAILLLRDCSYSRQFSEVNQELQQLQSSYSQLMEECEAGTKMMEQKILPAEKKEATIPTPQTIINSGENVVISKKAPQKSQDFSSKNNSSPTLTEAYFESGKGTSSLFQKKENIDLPALPEAALKFPETEAFHLQTALIAAIPMLPLTKLENVEEAPKVNLNLSPLQKSGSARISYAVSAQAALSLTGNRLTGAQPDIITGQKALLAYRAGLGFEALLTPHWSVETGVQYATSRIQTDYNLEVPYTHVNEFQHVDGNFDNQYNHSLPSTLGNYPAAFVLTRSSDIDVNEGDVMNLDLSIRQRTQYLSVPLHLRYSFGEKRWRAGIKGGLVGNRILGVSSEFSSLVSHHDAIHQRHTSIGNPSSNDLEKMTLDLSIGLDVQYKFTPHFSLSLASNYQRGITPVYQDDLVKNYLQIGNLGLGLTYQF